MMEILVKGTPPGDVLYTGTCGECKTKVRFKYSESNDKGGPDYQRRAWANVVCPVCRGTIYGKPEEMPR